MCLDICKFPDAWTSATLLASVLLFPQVYLFALLRVGCCTAASARLLISFSYFSSPAYSRITCAVWSIRQSHLFFFLHFLCVRSFLTAVCPTRRPALSCLAALARPLSCSSHAHLLCSSVLGLAFLPSPYHFTVLVFSRALISLAVTIFIHCRVGPCLWLHLVWRLASSWPPSRRAISPYLFISSGFRFSGWSIVARRSRPYRTHSLLVPFPSLLFALALSHLSHFLLLLEPLSTSISESSPCRAPHAAQLRSCQSSPGSHGVVLSFGLLCIVTPLPSFISHPLLLGNFLDVSSHTYSPPLSTSFGWLAFRLICCPYPALFLYLLSSCRSDPDSSRFLLHSTFSLSSILTSVLLTFLGLVFTSPRQLVCSPLAILQNLIPVCI